MSWSHLESRNPSWRRQRDLAFRAEPAGAPAGARPPPEVVLPPPLGLDRRLDGVLAARRSVHAFTDAPLDLASLATVLHGAAAEGPDGRGPSPSAGGLRAVQVSVLAVRSPELPAGLYDYDGVAHGLVTRVRAELGDWLRHRVLLQPELAKAPAWLLFHADLRRLVPRYGPRAYRLAHLEAGHLAQNALLVAAALGIGACAVGGYVDEAVDEALGLDGVEALCLLLVALGTPA